MPVRNLTDMSEDGGTSFVRQARRAQLADVAIALIAEVGLSGASTVAVARRAGVSRGVLTYHFRDKDDLLEAVVERVYAAGREQVSPEVTGADDLAAALRAFVERSVEFYVAYPEHMAALSAVFAAGRARASCADHHRELDELGALLRAGCRSGVFRDFDVSLMTASVRALLDLALTRIRAGDDPGLVRSELVANVDALTAARA